MKKTILAISLLITPFTSANADMTGIPKNTFSTDSFFAFSIGIDDPVANSYGIFESWYCVSETNTVVSPSYMMQSITAAIASNTSVTIIGQSSGSPGSCVAPNRLYTNNY